MRRGSVTHFFRFDGMHDSNVANVLVIKEAPRLFNDGVFKGMCLLKAVPEMQQVECPKRYEDSGGWNLF